MKVKEVIEKLQKINPEAEIVTPYLNDYHFAELEIIEAQLSKGQQFNEYLQLYDNILTEDPTTLDNFDSKITTCMVFIHSEN